MSTIRAAVYGEGLRLLVHKAEGRSRGDDHGEKGEELSRALTHFRKEDINLLTGYASPISQQYCIEELQYMNFLEDILKP
jgi:hypothetical protein